MNDRRQFRPCMRALYLAPLVVAVSLLMAASGEAQPAKPPTKMPLPAADPPPTRIVKQGVGTTMTEDLIPCAFPEPGMNLRKSSVGEITAKDGTKLTVPAATNYATAPKLPDLYNECTKVTPKSLAEVDLNKVPIVEIDKDGEVATGILGGGH